MGYKVKSLQKTVAAAGTAEELGADQEVVRVSIKALSGNTGDIYVGASDVSSTNGHVLGKGEEVDLYSFGIPTETDTLNLSDIYLDCGTDGDGVTAIYYY